LEPQCEIALEPAAIFTGFDKRFYHFGVDETAIELVQFCQPEVVAGIVERRFGGVIRIASQVSKVLHQHEGAIEFLLLQRGVLSYISQCAGAEGDTTSIRSTA